jgi:hypothetical protein
MDTVDGWEGEGREGTRERRTDWEGTWHANLGCFASLLNREFSFYGKSSLSWAVLALMLD